MGWEILHIRGFAEHPSSSAPTAPHRERLCSNAGRLLPGHFLKILFYIGVQLINNVVLVPSVSRYTYMCIYSFQILPPFRLLQNTEQSSGHHLVAWTHLGQPERMEPQPDLLQSRDAQCPLGCYLCLRKLQLSYIPNNQRASAPGAKHRSRSRPEGERELLRPYLWIPTVFPPTLPTQREREELACHFSELAPPSRGLASAPPEDTQHCRPAGGAAQTRG